MWYSVQVGEAMKISVLLIDSDPKNPSPDLLPSLNTIKGMPPGGLIAGKAPQALKNGCVEVVQKQTGVQNGKDVGIA